VVAGYLLWRLLLPGRLHLAVTLPVLLWLLAAGQSVRDPGPGGILSRGRWPRSVISRWGGCTELPAGLIGGLSIVLNWAFLIYGALASWRWPRLPGGPVPTARGMSGNVALTIVVALVVASWYLIPYLAGDSCMVPNRLRTCFRAAGSRQPAAGPRSDTAGRPWN